MAIDDRDLTMRASGEAGGDAAAARSNVIAGAIGSVLEWYDFAIYGYLAPIIGTLFFPADDPVASLLAAFGVSLAYGFPRSSLCLAAAILLVVYGLGITGAGLYSCDPGCPSQHLSFDGMMHRVVSISAFLAGILGIALWARCFRSIAAWRSLSRYSAVSSAMALVFLLLVGATEQSRVFTGVWQRLSMLTMDLWCALVGLRVFRSGAGGVRTT